MNENINEELKTSLREYAEWAESHIYEVPIMLPDCLAYAACRIERLEAQIVDLNKTLEQVKVERDAAADDIELGVCCETCKHDNDDDEGAFCVGCVRVTSRGNWEWRGVKSDAPSEEL